MVECELRKRRKCRQRDLSFNRYMVECECVRIYAFPDAVCSFNRYMVECEYMTGWILDKIKGVLIDTWWNVNEIYVVRCYLIAKF